MIRHGIASSIVLIGLGWLFDADFFDRLAHMERPEPQPARSAFYDGLIYSSLVDRLSAGLHRRIAERVPASSRVLDAACGTGGLALRLARRCREVVGVDLSPRQIRQAERNRRRQRVANLRFELGDLARLDGFEDGAFDLATLLMALHEMPDRVRPAVLSELARVAGQVLVVDFQVPLPRNASGLSKRLIELAAGPRHFSAFRRYCRSGGLAPILAAAGLRIADCHVMGAGTLELIRLTR